MTMSKTCTFCDGTGQKRWKHRESEHHSSGSVTECPICNGTGIIDVQIGNIATFNMGKTTPFRNSKIKLRKYKILDIERNAIGNITAYVVQMGNGHKKTVGADRLVGS
jgi:hypothetical protein